MNHIYKSFLSLLLIVMITGKVALPVLQLYKSFQQTDIEQQEQKSTEESDEKKADPEKPGNDVAELSWTHSLLPAHHIPGSLYHSYFVSLLPARYFAVPTPPPWQS